jgi:hypothetical protein
MLDKGIRELSSTTISPIGYEPVTVSLAAAKVVQFWREKLDLFGLQYTQPEPHLSTLALCNPQQFLFAHID